VIIAKFRMDEQHMI